MATEETLEVIDGFVGSVDGTERVFREGDLYRSTDPAVKKWPDKFRRAKFARDDEARVEQATRAPGERR